MSLYQTYTFQDGPLFPPEYSLPICEQMAMRRTFMFEFSNNHVHPKKEIEPVSKTLFLCKETSMMNKVQKDSLLSIVIPSSENFRLNLYLSYQRKYEPLF
jgi:hypothetical protein